MSLQLDLFGGHQASPDQIARFARAGDALPKVARELIEVIGHQATMKLVAECGGLNIIVPGWPLKRASSRFERLAGIIGQPAAEAFANRWGGIELAIPRCSAALAQLRTRRVIEAYEKGDTPATIARREGTTERTVWRWLKQNPGPT